MRFTMPEELGDADATGAAWLQLGKADMVWLITIGVVALVALFALGFVIRPLALKLAIRLPTAALAAPQDAGAAALTAPDAAQTNPMLLGSPPGNTTDKDTMLNIANVQGEVRASSIRQLGRLVETHPDASVTVIRGWLAPKAH